MVNTFGWGASTSGSGLAGRSDAGVPRGRPRRRGRRARGPRSSVVRRNAASIFENGALCTTSEVAMRGRNRYRRDQRGPASLHAVAGCGGLGNRVPIRWGRAIVEGETERMLVGWFS